MSKDVLEQRFISKVLREETQDLNRFQTQMMQERGFTSDRFLNRRKFNVNDNELEYTHPLELRFVDMKLRNTKSGERVKKKHHPIHNKTMFGFISRLLPRIQFEFTKELKDLLKEKK